LKDTFANIRQNCWIKKHCWWWGDICSSWFYGLYG